MLLSQFFVLFYLSPVQCWLLRIFEAEDGSTSTITLVNGDIVPPIPDPTRCVQLTVPDHAEAPNSYGKCSTFWNWSNCTTDFDAPLMPSNHCSPGLSTVTCRQKNGFFNVCAIKSCPDSAPGVWSTWGSWGSCNTLCGPGQETRTRTCDVQPGGEPCPQEDSNEENRPCNMDCKAINVSNHGIGTLGDWEHCPNLFQVNQFNIKWDDGKGITGIKLVCNDPGKNVITSGGVTLYHLADLFACSEAYNKIRTRWQPDGGALVDDLGLTCFELFCPSTGLWQTPYCPDSDIDNLETLTSECPVDQAVCGIQTRVFNHFSDSAGVTDVSIGCCHLPPPH